MSKDISFTVTGATGFIGQALCAELSRQGFFVKAYGRSAEFSARPGIQYTCVNSYFEVVGSPSSVCIHLAGENSLAAAENQTGNPLTDAVQLSEHICDQRFASVVCASSAAVYGDRAMSPHRENGSVNCLGAYAQLKHAVEEVVLRRRQIVARIANVYGPGMSKKNVFSDILGQLGTSGPVRMKCLFPVRYFIHVTDLTRGLICLAVGKEPGVFNLGTGFGASIADIANRILDITGQRDRGICCIGSSHSHSCIILDCSKIKQSYGWGAQVELRQGLKELVHSAREGAAGQCLSDRV